MKQASGARQVVFLPFFLFSGIRPEKVYSLFLLSSWYCFEKSKIHHLNQSALTGLLDAIYILRISCARHDRRVSIASQRTWCNKRPGCRPAVCFRFVSLFCFLCFSPPLWCARVCAALSRLHQPKRPEARRRFRHRRGVRRRQGHRLQHLLRALAVRFLLLPPVLRILWNPCPARREEGRSRRNGVSWSRVDE